MNLALVLMVWLIGLERIFVGLSRGKQVGNIALVVILAGIFSMYFLIRLSRQFFTTNIPNHYRPLVSANDERREDWQWQYFVFGSAMIVTPFLPSFNRVSSDSGGSSCGSNGSSDGSSCGSSCSSCGGCGGGD